MLATGNKKAYYNLSIRVKADGFSFLVTEGNSGDILVCRDFPLDGGRPLHTLVAEKLALPEITSYHYARVRVVVMSDMTCIPQHEFVADNLTDLYNIVFPALDEQEYDVHYTHLPQLDIVMAFALSRSLREAVTHVYPDATFTTASAVVLGRIATCCMRQQLPDNALFAYTTPTSLYLYSVSQERLLFANSFNLDQPRDSLFYLLSVWKTMELNPRKHSCYVAGEEESVRYLKEALVPYLQNIEVLSISIEN